MANLIKKFDLGKGRVIEVEVLDSKVTPICVGTYEEISLVRDINGNIGYIKQIIDDVDRDEPANYIDPTDVEPSKLPQISPQF